MFAVVSYAATSISLSCLLVPNYVYNFSIGNPDIFMTKFIIYQSESIQKFPICVKTVRDRIVLYFARNED